MSFYIKLSAGKMLHAGNFVHAQTLKKLEGTLVVGLQTSVEPGNGSCRQLTDYMDVQNVVWRQC